MFLSSYLASLFRGPKKQTLADTIENNGDPTSVWPFAEAEVYTMAWNDWESPDGSELIRKRPDKFYAQEELDVIAKKAKKYKEGTEDRTFQLTERIAKFDGKYFLIHGFIDNKAFSFNALGELVHFVPPEGDKEGGLMAPCSPLITQSFMR